LKLNIYLVLQTLKYQTAETLTKQKHCYKIATHVLQPCIIGKWNKADGSRYSQTCFSDHLY